MKIYHWTIAAALSVAVPVTAAAQSPSPPTPTPAVQPPPASTTSTTTNSYAEGRWIASGFVGSNFANNANPASTDYGGSLAFLFRNSVGGEIDLGFTPNFQLQNNFFGLGVEPQVNTYMANAAWAPPLGADGQWQPFLSAGVGGMSLRSGLGSTTDAFGNTFSGDSTRFGGDLGGGVMGFAGNWGFKADVRYYRATGTYNTAATTVSGSTISPTTPYVVPTTGTTSTATTSDLASAALAGLHFWRANIGVALRW